MCVHICVYECVLERERVRDCVTVCMHERQRMRMHVHEDERELVHECLRECAWTCAWRSACARECVYMWAIHIHTTKLLLFCSLYKIIQFNGLDWSLLVKHLELKIHTTLGYIVSLTLFKRISETICPSVVYILNKIIIYFSWEYRSLQ